MPECGSHSSPMAEENMKAQRILTIASLSLVIILGLNFKQQTRYGKEPGQRSLLPQRLAVANFARTSKKSLDYAQDQLLVKFKPTMSLQSIRSTLSAYQTGALERLIGDIYVVQIAEHTTVEEMIFSLKQNAAVEFVEPDYIARIAVTPNDTLFSDQWALYNTGQELPVPGSPTGEDRADIHATAAWEETKGSSETVIAVIDTGVDMLHPDLMNKLVSTGWDFVNGDDDASDDNGHGTFVAGLAAAETDNGIGISGVAWNCTILPVKSMADDGEGSYSWVIKGIEYAIENEADVINLSLGGTVHSEALEDAVREAYFQGITVVASVGNDSEMVLYPAAYDAYVLAVAATDYNDIRPDWSNHGPEVDVAAPGVLVISCVPTWYFGPGAIPYGVGEGTSFACPHAAGMVSLIISEKPWLTPGDIMNILRYTADDVNGDELPGLDEFIGYGRINMQNALVPIKIK